MQHCCLNYLCGIIRDLLFLVVLLAVLPTWGQERNHSFTLTGKVKSSAGEELAGASVYLHELRKGVSTIDDGSFRIPSIRPGFYHLHISLVGYQSQSIDMDLRDSLFHWEVGNVHEVKLNITLKPTQIELKEIIIESNPLKLSKDESPVDILVVNQEQILENAGFTLMRSIERLPGINSFNTGIGISKPIIRGLGFNRVAVSENGIKQEGQQWGADHGLEIDQYNVDRIEILKGPASLVYGSEAIGGVLKIQQNLPSHYGERRGNALLNYRGVNNTFGASAMYEGNDSGFVYRARITALSYADYRIPADSFTYNRFVLPLYDNRAKNTAGQELHAALTTGVNRSWGYVHGTLSNYHQRIGIFPGATGIPRAYKLQPDGDIRNIDLPNQEINHFKAIANSNILMKNSWLEMDAGYQNNLRDEFSAPHAHGYSDSLQGNLAHRLRLQTVSLNSRFHFSNQLGNAFIIGFTSHYQWNRISGYEFIIPDFDFSNAGIFILNKRSWNQKLHFTWGFRLDGAQIKSVAHYQPMPFNPDSVTLRSAAVSRTFGNWSGSAGLAYKYSEKWSLRANIGRYFRIPTPQELTANGIHHGTFRHEMGDPTLNPEQGLQFDLGITCQSEKLSVEFTPFVNYFSNHIFLKPTGKFSPLPEGGQIFRFTEAEAVMAGGELSAEWHIMKEFHLAAGLEYVYAQNLSEGIPLPFIPPAGARLEASYIFTFRTRVIKTLKLNSMYSLFAAQNRTDRNEWATPGYQLWDAGLALSGAGNLERLQLLVNVQNLLNTTYLSHLSRWRIINLPEPGRNLSITLKISI